MKKIAILLFALGLPLAAQAYEEVPQSAYDAGGDQAGSAEATAVPAPAGVQAASPAAVTGTGAGSGAGAPTSKKRRRRGKPTPVIQDAGAAAAAPGSMNPAASSLAAPVSVTPAAKAVPAPLTASTDTIDLNQVNVLGRAANLVGRADSAASGSVGQADLSERALLRPAEVLEAVPGLLITQHSGDGKANQYFTRGFNLDHGTDFAFSMDGVPVNEVSNAHGQGYTDLNFMIPELVQSVNYNKGPFNIEAGDFNTAGSADFVYANRLKSGIASLTLGEFGYQRAVAASQLSLFNGNLIYALEINGYDGPWTTPEQFKKYNGFLRYSAGPADSTWTVSFSGYEASWYATNQVPEQAIDEGLVNSFGNENPTDGGNRRRDFLWATWTGKTGGTETDVLAYLGVSHLDLWNDFTFYEPYTTPDCDFCQSQFANPDATGGEQFLEQDGRTREGGTARYKFPVNIGPIATKNEAGLDVRNDNITLGLYNTTDRVPYETDSLNHVVETSAGPYFKNTTQWTPWLKSELGFRQDFYYFNVINETPVMQDGINLLDAPGPTGPNDELTPLGVFSGGAGVGTNSTYHANMPEPKAALVFRPDEGPVDIYLNYGRDFHSNDARELNAGVNPLARAEGEELGVRYASGSLYETTLAAWRLNMSSELTFDGDSAGSNLNGASERQGLEWSNTFRAKPVYLDLDGALSQARFYDLDTVDDPDHPGYWVPEAIEQVGTATLGLDKMWGWSADARLRYFGSRALVPDDSVRSDPDTLVSLHISRDLFAGQLISFDVFNLFNAAAQDVSYYYAYALRGQAAQEGVVGHATEPRSIRVSWIDRF